MDVIPGVFLSHSHVDKSASRALARELHAYGFPVWIDDVELRLGAVLSPSLKAHIEEMDVLVVVASAASATSTWVALEIAHAVEHGKIVVPFYISPVATAAVFSDHLGIDASSPTGFIEGVHRLIAGLLPPDAASLSEPDTAILEADLRTLALEEPDIRPLISQCLDYNGEKVLPSALDDPDFYSLDYALHALMELKLDNNLASLAAHGFRYRGAGAAALSRWITISGDGGLPVVTAVGDRLGQDVLDAAIELLRGCHPPNNHALYMFISHNSEQLSPLQSRATQALVLSPDRGPERMGDILGRVALKQFPASPEILRMWTRWISGGKFDGEPRRPSELARFFAIAEQDELPGLNALFEALRMHVRGYLRSGNQQEVGVAVDHLRANADENTGALAALCREASGVSATAEWNDWAQRDPKQAEEMAHYVFAFLQQAETDRDWLKAIQDYDRGIKFDALRRQALGDQA